MQKELKGKKSTQRKGNSNRLLAECQKCLLLRKFEDSILLSCEALLDSSSSSSLSSPSSSSLKSSRENGLDICLSRLGSLTQDQFPQKFDGTPFIVILIQSLFGLDSQLEKQGKEGHYYQTVLQFLSNFYGRVDRFPFEVLFLCVNLLVIGKHYKEAKSMLHYALEIDNLSPPTSSSLSSNKTKTVFNADETEKLVQIYIFHVLPNLDQIPEGLAYLETPVEGDFDNQSDYKNPLDLLPKWKRDAFKEQLNKLLDESNENKKKQRTESVNNIVHSTEEKDKSKDKTKKSPPSENHSLAKTHSYTNLFTSFWIKHQSKILFAMSVLALIGLYSKIRSKPSQPKRFQGRIQSRQQNSIRSSNNSSNSIFSGISQLFSSLFSYSGKPIV